MGVCIFKDGEQLAYSDGGTVVVRKISSGEKAAEFGVISGIDGMTFNSEKDRLAISTRTGNTSIWNLDHSLHLISISNGQNVGRKHGKNIAFSDDNHSLSQIRSHGYSQDRGNIVTWKAEKEEYQIVDAGEGELGQIFLSKDSQFAYIMQSDLFQELDLKTGTLKRADLNVVSGKFRDGEYSNAFSRGGNVLFRFGDREMLNLSPNEFFDFIRSTTPPSQTNYNKILFNSIDPEHYISFHALGTWTVSPNGKKFVMPDGPNINTGELTAWYAYPPAFCMPATYERVTASKFICDGRHVVIGGSRGTITVWEDSDEVKIPTENGEFKIPPMFINEDQNAKIWFPDIGNGPVNNWKTESGIKFIDAASNGLIATGHANGNIYLWNVDGEEPVAELDGHISSIQSLRFASDGQVLISADKTGVARVWNLDNIEFRSITKAPRPKWDGFVDLEKNKRLKRNVDNLKAINRAMIQYKKDHGYYPLSKIKIPGSPEYSWRVALLPYLGDHAKAIYERYNFDEEWNSESNQELLAEMPEAYRHPMLDSESLNASYYYVVGKGALNDPTVNKPQQTSRARYTLLVVEAKRETPWTCPEDIPFKQNEIEKLGGFFKEGVAFITASENRDESPLILSREVLKTVGKYLVQRDRESGVDLSFLYDDVPKYSAKSHSRLAEHFYETSQLENALIHQKLAVDYLSFENATDPFEREYFDSLAEKVQQLGSWLSKDGKNAEALERYEFLARRTDEFLDHFPGDVFARHVKLENSLDLASCYIVSEMPNKAEPLLAENLRLLNTTDFGEDKTLKTLKADTLDSLGYVQWQLGHLEKANKHLAESIKLFEALLTNSSGESRNRRRIGIAIQTRILGSTFLQLGEFEKAEQKFNSSIAMLSEFSEENVSYQAYFLARAKQELGVFYREKGKYEKSIQLLNESNEVYLKQPNSDVIEFRKQKIEFEIAKVLAEQKEYTKVATKLNDVIERLSTVPQNSVLYDLELVASCRSELGKLSIIENDLKEAYSNFKRSLEIREDILAKFPNSAYRRLQLGKSIRAMGEWYVAKGNKGKATEYLKEAEKLFQDMIAKKKFEFLARKQLSLVNELLSELPGLAPTN